MKTLASWSIMGKKGCSDALHISEFRLEFLLHQKMDDKGYIVTQKKLPSNGEMVDFLKEFHESMEWRLEPHQADTAFMITCKKA